MAISLFFSWWYGAGWKNAFSRIQERVDILSSELSLGILLKTLFEPWKQITSYSGPSAALDDKLRVWLDNVFARAIGFVIRVFVLVFGSLAVVVAYGGGLLLAVLWPLVPLLPFVCIVLAVVTQ